MSSTNILLCSFYTDDEYYRGHAQTLVRNCERLGVEHDVRMVERKPGDDWADICRRKIGFLASVCEANPDKRVFWIDVDCSLLEIPSFVANFTADLIGFQRGFSSPLRIGYAHRTRFWEPCFFGINTTPQGRKFILDASLLEATADIKATDDYFFEESWRTNAANLSFQVIPSVAVLGRSEVGLSEVSAFFSFGASGKVSEFKGVVEQHTRFESEALPRSTRLRGRALQVAKGVERRLPPPWARSLRKAADTSGLTGALTGADVDAGRLSASGVSSPHRQRLVTQMVMAGQRGDVTAVEDAFGRLAASGVPHAAEVAAKRAADSFCHFAAPSGAGDGAIRLAWWVRPFPGNFGDWLSPMVLTHVSGRPVVYQSLTAASSASHLVSVGSVGRFIKPRSVVVGTGISSTDVELDRNATYVSVRGPITAELVRACGGPEVSSWGDPGALLRRIVPLTRGETNGRVALVRHFKHAGMALALPDTMDEISVLMSHPDSVRSFVAELIRYDGVVTSAMHVMIACHSYGIPCVLVTFEGLESAVHGTGIKYRDYALGVGLDTVHEPVAVPSDLRRMDIKAMLTTEFISEEKLDEIEHAVTRAVATYLEDAPRDADAPVAAGRV